MGDLAHKHAITPDAVKRLLGGGDEFLPPERMLRDLTEEQALAVPLGSFYSIAQIVAHMQYWQERNIARAQGVKPPKLEHLDESFPHPTEGEWDDLRKSFLLGLERCAQVAVEKAGATSPHDEDTSLIYDLAECPAFHNAYHLGQIAILRQIQGLWPPEGGDDSW